MDWYKYNINDMTKEEYDTYFALMSSEKRERVSRFKNIEDKKRSVCAEMLAKRAIAEKCGIKESDIIFDIQDGGKPFCKNAVIHFSISHSGDYAVCAVSDAQVGIDIQKIREYSRNTAHRVCSESELEIIEKSEEEATEFIKLWTKKEAVMKMKGIGIASPEVKNCLCGKNVKTVRFEDYFVSIYE